MTNLIRVVAVLGCAIALAASASAPSKHSVNPTATIAADFDATWGGVIDLFGERGWSIQTTEKASGIIATGSMWLDEGQVQRYMDCGSAGIASADRDFVRLTFRVKKSGSGTNVTVTAAFQEARHFDNRAWVVDCASTGRFEAEIHKMVSDRATREHAEPTAKKQGSEAPATPSQRGFFCTRSPSNAAVGTCAREKSACEATRAAMAGAVTDLTECALVETAWCAGDRCAPTGPACQAQRADGTECVGTK